MHFRVQLSADHIVMIVLVCLSCIQGGEVGQEVSSKLQ